MASFSPRQRPHTVNLSFTDLDLTDNFQDLDATFKSSSTQGGGGRRHPRGDTPLSRRGGQGGGTPSSTTATSRAGGGLENGAGGGLSNLDRLLDFLDGEEAEEELHHHGRERSSTPVSTTRRGGGDGSVATQRAIPPSTIKRLDTTSHRESPDSPSPRPGSVAAMRSGERSFILQQAGGGSFASGQSNSGTTAQRLQDEIEAEQRQLQEGEQVAGDGVSVDSITRVAQAALQEFDSIVSGGSSLPSTASRSSRPPSRLREFASSSQSAASASRPRSPATSFDHVSTIYDAGPTFVERSQFERGATESNGAHYSQPVPTRRHSPPAAIFSESSNQHREDGSSYDQSRGNAMLDPHELNLQLINELREAQDYISFLQTELRTIGQVVNKLRSREREAAVEQSEEDQHRRGRAPVQVHVEEGAKSQPVVGANNEADTTARRLEAANVDAFEIVKHLVAMIPSPSSSTTNPSFSRSPSIDSIVSSLRFVRQVDSLVNTSSAAQGSKGRAIVRRDEIIFEKGNLERLEEFVEGRLKDR
ncbi:uncharacterized protein JCM6883_007217 [Sporobolomyces salmoneus]|uniref:uncharacterized protein n=1 Tax=Sporobolomyces salmoneus TaxID=183962 RepID=UPI0031704331